MSSETDPPSNGDANSSSNGKKKTDRRKFLRALALATPAAAAGGLLAGLGARSALAKDQPALSLSPAETSTLRERFLSKGRMELAPATRVADRPSPGPGVEALSLDPGASGAAPTSAAVPSDESILLRMQRDLQRAMTKPRSQRKWIMVIDLRKCIGCSACTIACKAENRLPPGVVYRPVIEQEEGEYPNVTRNFLPRPCMQCEEPPCTEVCPVSATWKRDDGIVVIDYDACIGCRYCLAACPYGARYFDFGEYYTDDTPDKQSYEESASPEYGRRWTRDGGSSPVGNARKCQFCIHRLDAGMLPACVTTCIGGATYFGDKNDPEALVDELIARGSTSGRTMRLKEELGTEPKVYYLV
jgi:molybdopterin-containing oxidoreductase family iron-sulfur binding subunit